MSLLIEPHGEVVDDLADTMSIDEDAEFTIDGAHDGRGAEDADRGPLRVRARSAHHAASRRGRASGTSRRRSSSRVSANATRSRARNASSRSVSRRRSVRSIARCPAATEARRSRLSCWTHPEHRYARPPRADCRASSLWRDSRQSLCPRTCGRSTFCAASSPASARRNSIRSRIAGSASPCSRMRRCPRTSAIAIPTTGRCRRSQGAARMT